MAQSQASWRYLLQSLLISGTIALSPLPATAQRVPIADESLGNERSTVSPDQVIRGIPSNQIDGGARRGANLFHSFREFNIDAGRGAYFTNPGDVANIITRVTGSNRSDILGTLGVLGKANLFLINPNGILFGQNARLDVGGSFVSSTANGIGFDNGFAFSATDPQAPPLLTVNVPIGLQYGNNPGEIRSQGASLEVNQGQTLILAGGAVNIDGGQLLALGGRVELTGVAAPGEVGLRQQGQEWQLTVPDGLKRADVAIGNDGIVDVSAASGGSIAITAQNFTGTGEGRRLRAGIAAGLGTVGAQAGDIDINTTEAVELDASIIANVVQEGGIGNAGNIRIITGTLSLRNGAQISNSTGGQGNAGSTNITARNAVFLDGLGSNGLASGILSRVGRRAIGQAGGVNIDTGSVAFSNGALIDASTLGRGNAGSINITARDKVSFDGNAPDTGSSEISTGPGFPSGAYSDVAPGAIGKGGNIRIDTGSLSATNGAGAGVNTAGQGDAGNITITARDAVFIGGGSNGGFSGFVSQVFPQASGNGGDIRITTGSLSVFTGGLISTATAGRGNAGNITISARDTVSIDGVTFNSFGASGVFTQVLNGATGRGGNINITTGSFALSNGAQMLATTFGQGDAGSITITAEDKVSVRDRIFFEGAIDVPSTISTSVGARGNGRGGNIRIITDNLSISNGGIIRSVTSGAGQGNAGDIDITAGTFSITDGFGIFSVTQGRGNAGNITLAVGNTISLNGLTNDGFPSQIASGVNPNAVGQGGNIRINTGSLSLAGGAVINASTEGQGNAGDIIIRSSNSIYFDGIGSNGFASGTFSAVESGATGRGGNIRISAGDLSLSNGAQVSAATSGQGRAGNITFNTPRLTVAGNAQVLAATSNIGNGGSIVVNAPTSVNLRRTNNLSPVLSVETSGAGQAGDITINTPRLTLAERARITATATATATNPQGGGSVTLNASDLNLSGIVGVFAETQGQSPAGTLRFNPYRNQPDLDITLTPRSQISASTSGSGRGGDLIVTAPRSIAITGAGRLAVTTNSTGNAGNMTFTTQQLSLSDGVNISASTSATGRAGDIDINAERFTLSGGAQVSTNTASKGAAGDLTVEANDQLFLTGRGTGLFASTTPGSTGRGGNIAIDPRRVQIEDGATIAVDSQGRGRGGNISLQADRLVLNRQGSITAETTSAQGGDIRLQVPDLLLLGQGSSISTTAGNNRTGGDGGNISFDGQFIVAAPNENSDISADAFTGRGGNVEINAQSLFGIQSRSQQTPQSDITASSKLGVAGVVDITTPDVDPSRGLVQLPVEVSDASRLIAQTCPTGNSVNQQNQFIITGRGGLPPIPSEAMNRDAIQVELVTANAEDQPSVSQRESSNHSSSATPIAEAQGFQIASDGKVILVAAVPERAIGRSPNRLIHCR